MHTSTNKKVANPMMREMMDDIINSKLTPAQKLFLIVENMLRVHVPHDLQNIKLSDTELKVKNLVAKRLSSDFLEDALGEVKSLLNIDNHKRILALIIGLAYYSYIDSEFVYDHELRLKMMSRVSEFGVKLSEIEKFHDQWVRIFGDSETIFNKMLEK